MEKSELEVGKLYYFGNDNKKFKCEKIDDVQSVFTHNDIEYKFYNHDMFNTPYVKTKC